VYCPGFSSTSRNVPGRRRPVVPGRRRSVVPGRRCTVPAFLKFPGRPGSSLCPRRGGGCLGKQLKARDDRSSRLVGVLSRLFSKYFFKRPGRPGSSLCPRGGGVSRRQSSRLVGVLSLLFSSIFLNISVVPARLFVRGGWECLVVSNFESD